MTESEEPTTIENRIDKIGEDLHALRGLYQRHDASIQRVAEVQTKQADELVGLRVLYEHHDEQVQRIAEVQTAHGVKLDRHGTLLEEHGKLLREIKGALKPLPEIHDFVKRIASEHEVRITALEKLSS